jgi:multicomponent Na+:H+ antiporter subunit D
MAAGAVVEATGNRKLTELGGLFSAMPLTFVLTTVGAMSLSALPGTCGFVSKPMVLAAAADANLALTWLFWRRPRPERSCSRAGRAVFRLFRTAPGGLEKRPARARGPAGGPCGHGGHGPFVPGPWGVPRAAFRPFALSGPGPAPFAPARIAATLELLAFAGLFFAVYAPVLRRQPGITLDTDWFYRAGGRPVPAGGHGRPGLARFSRT